MTPDQESLHRACINWNHGRDKAPFPMFIAARHGKVSSLPLLIAGTLNEVHLAQTQKHTHKLMTLRKIEKIRTKHYPPAFEYPHSHTYEPVETPLPKTHMTHKHSKSPPHKHLKKPHRHLKTASHNCYVLKLKHVVTQILTTPTHKNQNPPHTPDTYCNDPPQLTC